MTISRSSEWTWCRECHEKKSVDEFYSTAGGGIRRVCKACYGEQQKADTDRPLDEIARLLLQWGR